MMKRIYCFYCYPIPFLFQLVHVLAPRMPISKELKNLGPQLYSAAEYCEKSYLHSERKQMVLDSMKDYAVQCLVNAVDHLGIIAYKLTALLEQQTLDASAMEFKVSCLNQLLLTCQMYMDKEGLRQQQLLTIIPKHHKHYILPSTPTSKTLSWHLASATKSNFKRTSCALMSAEDPKDSGKNLVLSHLLAGNRMESSGDQHKPPHLGPFSSAAMQTWDISQRQEHAVNFLCQAENTKTEDLCWLVNPPAG